MGVVGRDEELGSIDAFLDDTLGGPTALVLTGEAGIGKTILWQECVDAAEQRFGRVLTCRGVEAEASLSFAGLSELFAPVLADTLETLAAPRRRALQVALLLEEPGDVIPDAHAIGLAVLDVLRAVAEQGPYVLAVDDLQWLDPASGGVLQVALRRLRDEPIGLLVTVREPTAGLVPIELERCYPPPRLRRRSVGPLSLTAMHRLLQEQLGLELSQSELLILQEATVGNPFFALAAGRELSQHGKRLRSGEPLPLPSSLTNLLGRGLARLSRETRGVLLIVALAGRPTIELIAAAEGNPDRVLMALDEAVEAGVVERDGSRVRFTHPLFASVVHDQASPELRAAVHHALAGTVGDVEERARHLTKAANGPNASIAAEVAAAAEHAAARGAPAAGAELYELAGELTPADPALSRRRRLHAATLHRLAGDRKRAMATLELLRAQTPPGVERADVLFELARTRRADSSEMVRLCDQALAEAAGDDLRCARLLAYQSFAYMFAGDVANARSSAHAALAKAERVGDAESIALAIARIGQADIAAADARVEVLERGADIELRSALALGYYESPRVALARLLMRVGRVEPARGILEDLYRRAEARGDEDTSAQVLGSLTICDWLAGRWGVALERAVEAHERMERTHESHGRGVTGRVKSLVETDLGLVEQARASAQHGLAAAQEMSDGYFVIASTGVLGRIELALGNVSAAGDHLRDLPQMLLTAGINDPANPVWADTIEALTMLGELDRAHSYLTVYERSAHRLQSPDAMAASERLHALLAASEGDLAGAVAAAGRAMAILDECNFPFERGRVLLTLGSVLRHRQQRSEGRASLAQALAIFEELGARLWAERAREELRRISGRRPAALDGLTDTELEVATLAANGRSNKDIAAVMHIGVSTVEAHLSRVYRKLGGIHRAELATRLRTLRGDDVTPSSAD